MSGRSENIRFNVYLNDKQAGQTMGSLYKQSRMLKSELKKLEIGSAAWVKKLKEVQKVEKDLQRVRSEIRGTNSLFSRLASSFNKYFGVVTAGIASISGLVYAIKNVISYNIKLSDSFANVRKTTDLTRSEVRKLYSEFSKFNTRTPRKELLMLAEEAGRLGIRGRKNILDFVGSANKINVALGDDLGDSAGKAILEVGKITTNLKVAEKYGVSFSRAMDMAGSSVNELAQNTKAKAPYIIDWSKRLSGVAKNANISAQDIFGMAATFDESGQTLEMSATAVNKVLVDMFTNTSKYAEITGMSVSDLSELLKTDANEAFIKLLESLNKNNDGFQVMANRLDELGIDGARAVQAISSLAADTENLKKNQDLANKALKEGTSLTNEYNIKNENLAANTEKLGRKIRSWFINSRLVGWLEDSVRWIVNLGREISTASSLMKEYNSNIAQERSQMEILFTTLSNANEGTELRKKTIDKINELYGDYLPNLLTEKSTTDDIALAYDKANKGLIRNLTLKARENDLQTIVNESLVQQKEIVDNIITDISEKKGDNVAAVALTEIYDILEKIKTMDSMDDVKDVVGSFARRYRDANQNVGTYAENLKQFIAIMKLQSSEQKELNKLTLFYNELIKQLGGEVVPDPTGGTGIGGGGKDTKTKEQIKKQKELNETIEQLKRDAELKDMSSQEREIALVNDKYDKLVISAKGYDSELKRLNELRNAELKRLSVKHAKENQIEIDKQVTRDVEIMEENFKRTATLRETEYNNQLKALKGNKQAQRELTKKYEEEEYRATEEFMSTLANKIKTSIDSGEWDGLSVQDLILSDAEKEKLTQKLLEIGLKLSELKEIMPLNKTEGDTSFDIFGMSSDNWITLLDNLNKGKLSIEDMRFAISSLIGVWNDVNQIRTNNENKQLAEFEKNNNLEKSKLENRLKQQLISQSQYNDAVKTLEDEVDLKRADLAQKQAKREKEVALVGAIVNTALGIAKALTIMPPPVGIALAAIVGALGAVQIAKIASTETPAYAKGGIAQGASHAEGGIHMIDSKTGKKVGEMEGDEPYMILSKETYKNNTELVNALLDTSMNKGGERVEWMAPGYYSHPDVSSALTNLLTQKYAAGAITNVNNVYQQQQPGSPPVSNAEMVSLLTEIRDGVNAFKYVKAILDLDGTLDLKETLSELDSLETNAGI